MIRNPTLSRLAPLLEGRAAGHYELPKALLAAVDAVALLGRKTAESAAALDAVSPGALRDRFGSKLLDAALAGKALPVGWEREIVAAEEERRAKAVVVEVVGSAAERAGDKVQATLNETAEEATSLLREAMEESLAAVRKVAAVAAKLPLEDLRAMMDQEPGDIAPYHAIEGASKRYGAVRAAQRHLAALVGEPSRDALEHFREFKGGVRAIWPAFGGGMPGSDKAPWPEHPLRRMLWLVTEAPEVWLPTADECQAAYEKFVSEHRLRPRETEVGVSPTYVPSGAPGGWEQADPHVRGR